jgi:hypothetical protein
MDFLVLMIILLLAGIALWLVLYPLWPQKHPNHTLLAHSDHRTLEEYEAQYQAALAAIKDISFDYEMGKVSAEDYETQLTKVKLEAAKIRQQFDLLNHAPELEPANELLDAEIDAEIERLITQLRQGSTSIDEALAAEVEVDLQALKSIPAIPDRACRNCGRYLQAADLFCSGCGQPVDQPKIDDEPQAETCPECGYSFQIGDVFCARCGAALAQTVPSQNYENAKI